MIRGVDLARFGRAIRALRRRRRWRQVDLANSAGMSPAQVGRIERGEARRLPIDAFDRAAQAVGASLDLALRWQGEGLDRLLDEEHARLVDLVVRLLRAMGWEIAVEVSFSVRGERGSIDVLAFRPDVRMLAMFEVKSVTPDMQAMLGGIDRKGRLAAGIARERGWIAVSTARILVLADTRTNRRRLATHDATVRSMLSSGTRETVRWLRDPQPPGVSGVWFLADRRSADASPRGRERVAIGRAQARTSDSANPAIGSPDGAWSRRA